MNNTINTRQAVILGALLHDIGKFAQRGGEQLTSEYKNLEHLCCSQYRGRYTRQHVLYSGQYTKHFLGIEEVENRVLYHHNPNNFEDKIIQLADWLSCGERREREIEEEVPEIKEEPLISIFSQIVLKDESNNEIKIDPHYCPVEKIEDKIEKLFPKKQKQEAINDKINFKKLWEEFKEESKLLDIGTNFDHIISKVLSLLEKYTLFVPSSAYKDKPEIPLFHHAKSTAAIATCLFDLNINEEIDKVKQAIENNWQGEILKKESFTLLGGDISGIQDFIYSVTSEHALKGLRGRSFYLQLLTEIIARKFLDEFNLPPCNLLFLGGGNFTILLPYTDKTKSDEITKEIQQKIFNAHKGKFGLILAYVNFTYNDFQGDNFGKVIEKLSSVLAREKRRKFREIIDYNLLFKPYPEKITKELKGCEICGEEIEQGNRCNLCESFIDLANKIKRGKYIELEKVKRGGLSQEITKWYELIQEIGYNCWIKENSETPDINNLVYALNNTNFLDKNYVGFRFEAIHSPDGTLEEMANNAGDKEKGIKRWASLRMDVDNLSKVFSEGLPNRTISRYSMLSYMFTLFFSMGIRQIIEEKYKNCCVVYSGGDDLFILGPWSDLPEIAQEIYDNFCQYTANHPMITLSGGIFIAPSKKFPVYQAANEAGEAEREAKKGKKNKITFLNSSLDWNKFKEVKEVSYDIVEVLNQGVARSLLTILYAGYQDKKLFADKKISMPRIWRLFYAIKRLMERHKNFADKLENLRKKFIIDFELLPELDVAVRWAELLTRKEKRKGGEKNGSI